MRLTRTSRPESSADKARPSLPDISRIGTPIAVTTNAAEIRRVNDEFSELTGFTETELKGKKLASVLKDYKLSRGALRGRSPLSTKDGGLVPVSYSISAVPGTDLLIFTIISRAETEGLTGELSAKQDELERRERYIECFREGVLKMINDLDRSETELKSALRNLQETQVQLLQSSKMTALGELSASLVHEISQPLTVIRGLTHGMLRTTPESSPCYSKVTLIGEAAARMEKIVKHLRTFSRTEPPALSPLDLNSVVKDAFLILNEHLLSHSIETVLDLSPLPLALGNPNRLEQVIINLVTNARDAMPNGGVLTLATRDEAIEGRRLVRLMVKDSGSGIPEEVIGRVFDPFFTTKETGKGTGLGLSISLGIVREHRGEIKVESTRGFGTAFHVIIPALT